MEEKKLAGKKNRGREEWFIGEEMKHTHTGFIFFRGTSFFVVWLFLRHIFGGFGGAYFCWFGYF